MEVVPCPEYAVSDILGCFTADINGFCMSSIFTDKSPGEVVSSGGVVIFVSVVTADFSAIFFLKNSSVADPHEVLHVVCPAIFFLKKSSVAVIVTSGYFVDVFQFNVFSVSSKLIHLFSAYACTASY